MQDVQKIFLSLQEKKESLKNYKKDFLALCEAIPEWNDLIETKKKYTGKINLVKQQVKDENKNLANKIEDLSIDIASEREMLNDILMSKFMKGEEVEITDKHENKYQTSFNFIFKKEL